MDVSVRWRQKQLYQLRVGFQSWSMLCRVSRDPRLRTALEVASRVQQELRLFQSAATQRFMDAEAAWRNEIEQEQEATKAATQKADNIAEDLRRTQSALEDSLGLLNQVEADKQRLIEYIKEQEQRETERMKHILRDLHRKIDENAGEREVNLQMLMTKDKEMDCLRKEVESLRSQVQLLHTFFASV
jgi:chromosome segregation ATPase